MIASVIAPNRSMKASVVLGRRLGAVWNVVENAVMASPAG
jgi:hypothetical protein